MFLATCDAVFDKDADLYIKSLRLEVPLSKKLKSDYVYNTQKQSITFKLECRYVYCGQLVFALKDKKERSR